MNCPICGSPNTKRNGWYRNNQERIQKYRCKDCLGDYTYKTDQNEPKQEHRPELNDIIVEMHLEGISQRNIASELKCSRLTVIRKLKKYL